MKNYSGKRWNRTTIAGFSIQCIDQLCYLSIMHRFSQTSAFYHNINLIYYEKHTFAPEAGLEPANTNSHWHFTI